jgi:NhaP-type Na+/H+ or K+/H+ antiporter
VGANEEKSTIQTALATITTGAIMGVAIGSITGITLIWLLKPQLQNHE